MEIDEIRVRIERGSFSVTDHALTEGFKDGITVDIVTTYIPQKNQWIKGQIRKRKKR